MDMMSYYEKIFILGIVWLIVVVVGVLVIFVVFSTAFMNRYNTEKQAELRKEFRKTDEKLLIMERESLKSNKAVLDNLQKLYQKKDSMSQEKIYEIEQELIMWKKKWKMRKKTLDNWNRTLKALRRIEKLKKYY